MLLLFHALGRLASAQDAMTPPATVTTRVRVEIAFDGPQMPPRVKASAVEEITRIWVPYGVDVVISDASDARQDADVRLTVALADRPNRPLASGALGSIVFLDDEPQPTITMYHEAIDALISGVRFEGTSELQWPTAFRDLIVGRVLGRGLAHEIGHYLLRARHHSSAGLMRAPHRVSDLVALDRHPFALSADEQARLAGRALHRESAGGQ